MHAYLSKPAKTKIKRILLTICFSEDKQWDMSSKVQHYQLPLMSDYKQTRSFSVKCHLCDTISTSSQSVRRHMAECHPGLSPFMCSLCGKGFLSDSGLYKHMYVHKGKSFTCPVCSKRFTHRFNMKKHMMVAHGLSIGAVQK